MDVGRKIELVGQIDRLAEIVELVLDVVVAKHLVDGEHVERAVLDCETVGLGQSLQDGLDLALAVLVDDGIDAPELPRAHEDRALGPMTMVRAAGWPCDQTSALKPAGSLILSTGILSAAVTVGGVACGRRLVSCLLAAGLVWSRSLKPGGLGGADGAGC